MNHTAAPLVAQLAPLLLRRGWMLATAESCTGGLIAAACTEQAGSSQWFERGFVTYSNAAKHDSLGVPLSLIEAHGAVSEPVAQAMAVGVLQHAPAQVAVTVTGIAGPTGGSPEKPVGTVWLAWAMAQHPGASVGAQTPWLKTECCRFAGDRTQVRQAALHHALAMLVQHLMRWTMANGPV